MAEISPLQLIAEASWGNNTAIALNTQLVLAIADYVDTPLLSPLANAIANAAAASVGTGQLYLLASNTCPALGNSPPAAYANALGNVISAYGNVVPPDPNLGVTNFSNIVTTIGQAYLSGNVGVPTNTGKFTQIFQSAQGFAQQNNQYINALNEINSNIAPTFTNYNNYVTGDLAQVCLATDQFGQDLDRLGVAINPAYVDYLGSPAALLAQIVNYGGLTDVLSQLLEAQRIPTETLQSVVDGDLDVEDNVNRKIYLALASVTASGTPQALQETLTALRVTTANITSLADLLNPVKIFPNSFAALSVPTAQGSSAIYINNTGAVNTSLLTLLPSYVINTVG